MTLFEDIIYVFRAFIIIAGSILILSYGCAYIDGELYKRSIEEKAAHPKYKRHAK